MEFRLHIDIPMGQNEEDALKIADSIIKMFEPDSDNKAALFRTLGISQINYRLGHDEDRQKSNYFIKDENGHIANKKIRIHIPG